MENINPNTIWATIIANELAEAGVKYACIASGSRATPLIFALQRNPKIECISFVDERSCGFFALGLSKGTAIPSVVVTTSGTAAANLFPAVIEAHMSNTPLIVLTGDRPHELRETGSNQTINQMQLFGGYTNWFVDLLPAQEDFSNRIIKYLRTTIRKAFFLSTHDNSGPVHINIPFRKPFEPFEDDYQKIGNILVQSDNKDLAPRISYSRSKVAAISLTNVINLIKTKKRGLIVAGGGIQKNEIQDIAKLSKTLNFPIFADILSNLRSITDPEFNVIRSYETFLQNSKKIKDPDLLLIFGSAPVSKFLLDYLESLSTKASVSFVFIQNHTRWADLNLNPDLYIIAEINAFCRELENKLTQEDLVSNSNWMENISRQDQLCMEIVSEIVKEYNSEDENVLTFHLSNLINEGTIFLGNSLPIRLFDQMVFDTNNLLVFGNRGGSGIDGLISTAAGIAFSGNYPLFAVVGDLSFYHDQNILFTLSRYNIKLIILVYNNSGGGLFQRLPVSKYKEVFDEFYLIHHKLTFKEIVSTYGLNYSAPGNYDELVDSIEKAKSANNTTIIEFKTNSNVTQSTYELISKKIKE